MGNIVILPRALVSFGLLISGCAEFDASSEPHDLSPLDLASESLTTLSADDEGAREAARIAIISSLARWDVAAVTRPVSASREAPTCLEYPIETARLLTSKDFAFERTKHDGADIYVDRDGTRLRVASAKGAWGILGAPAALTPDSPAFSREEARAAADRLADQLEVPSDERANVVEDDLMGRYSNGEAETFARHVRYHRQVNGLRVRGSIMMALFDLNGNAFRVERRWNPFVLAKGPRMKKSIELVGRGIDMLAWM